MTSRPSDHSRRSSSGHPLGASAGRWSHRRLLPGEQSPSVVGRFRFVGYSGGFMLNTQTLIAQAYSAFNHRDIASALALMTENVSWPKASEGGRVVGKEEIRSYWTRQWTTFDPHVEPLETTDLGGDKLEVRAHQLVKNLQGDVLSDSEVRHVFSVKDGLIKSMDLKGEEAGSSSGPSAAFAKH